MNPVLITGGAGYIGSHVAYALQAASLPYLIVDNLTTGHAHLLPPGATLIQADCGDTAAMADIMQTHGIQTVMHLAASLLVEESVREPLAYYQNNVGTTIGLLAACTQAGVEQVIFSSTAAVYGETGANPVKESAACAPVNPYGRTKLTCEWLLQDAAAINSLRFVALRYFNVAGADAQCRTGECPPVSSHLIKRLCEQVTTTDSPPLSIYGDTYATPDGTCVRDYLHVVDVAQAHLDAMAYLEAGKPSLTVNLGYGHGVSVREVIQTAEQVLGQPIATQVAPPRPGDSAIAVADATLAHAQLGWQPKHDNLTGIIQSALAWERHLRQHNGLMETA